MLSMGFAVAGSQRVSGDFEPMDPDAATFYVELKPISDRFIPGALAVSGLDRDKLEREAPEAGLAMDRASRWIRSMAATYDAKPIYVAYPLAFDWTFTHYYWERFGMGGDPFGFSNAIDIKTLFYAKSGFLLSNSAKKNMPKHIKTKRRHTHNALDDAKGQADIFANLMTRELW